jgi:hypothetical protein
MRWVNEEINEHLQMGDFVSILLRRNTAPILCAGAVVKATQSYEKCLELKYRAVWHFNNLSD